MNIQGILRNRVRRTCTGAFCMGLAFRVTGTLAAAEFSVPDYGAVADGSTDCTRAIQQAIDAAGGAGGGRVLIPAADKPYLVRRTLMVPHSNLEIEAAGATVRLADGALESAGDHVLLVAGSRTRTVTNVTVRGLTVDANYWNQSNTVQRVRNGQASTAFLTPRGVLVEFAQNVLLDKVSVRRAWVSLAFGREAVRCEARDCTVSQWHNDGFDAALSARDIRFLRCRAFDANNTAEHSGFRDGAWEIEDGVRNITLTDCSVADTSAIGFKLRSHNSVSVNRGIRFIRCSAFVYLGFYIQALDHDTRTEDVLLQDCRAPGIVYAGGGPDEVRIEGGSFGVLQLAAPRRLQIREASVGALSVDAAEAFDGKETYVPQVMLENVTLGEAPWISGDAAAVRIVGETPPAIAPETHFIAEDFKDQALCFQRIESVEDMVPHQRKGAFCGLTPAEGAEKGQAVWTVRRPAPIGRCRLGFSGYIPVNGTNGFLFSVSTDGGATWQDVVRTIPQTDNGRYPRVLSDITAAVEGRTEFLLKGTLQGAVRLLGLLVTTDPR